jgi:restriction system protein
LNNQIITPEDAFEVLHVFVESALAAAQDDGSEAMRVGRFEQVQAALDRARALEKLKKRIDDLAGDFHQLIAEAEEARESARLRRGLKTPETDYMRPVLEAVVELGGSANLNDVLDLVNQKMRGQLNDYDFAPLPSDGVTPRWRNTAQWARNTLRQQGLLRDDSPRSVWEISDKGRRWLEEN